jgi:hypothetical protein
LDVEGREAGEDVKAGDLFIEDGKLMCVSTHGGKKIVIAHLPPGLKLRARDAALLYRKWLDIHLRSPIGRNQVQTYLFAEALTR